MPVTARDFVFTHAAIRSVRRSCRTRTRGLRDDPQRHGRRREDGPRRPPLASRRLARPVPVRPAAARAPRRGLSRASGRTASTTRRPAQRSGAARSSSSAWERGKQLSRSSATRATGAATRLPRAARRSLLLPCAAVAAEQIAWMRTARSTSSRARAHRRSVQAAPRPPGSESSPVRGPGSTSTSASAGRPSRAEEPARPAGARLRDRPRRNRAGARRAQRDLVPAERQRALPDATAALPAELEAIPVPAGRGEAAARAGRLPQGAGRHLRLRRETALAPLRDARRERASEQTLELIQGQLRRVGIEVVPEYAPPRVIFDKILPSGDFDVAAFAWTFDARTATADRTALYGCGGVQNFTGYCQRLVTSDLDQAQRILDPDRQAAVLNRVDTRLASDVPVIPLFEIPRRRARDDGPERSHHRAVDPFVGRGGLVARGASPRRGDRRLAPRRLGSGRRATRRRRSAAARVVIASARPGACLSEPFDARCVLQLTECSAGAVDDRFSQRRSTSRPDFTCEAAARLERRLHDEASPSRSRTTFARRLAGATACRSRRPDFVFTHRALLTSRLSRGP